MAIEHGCAGVKGVVSRKPLPCRPARKAGTRCVIGDRRRLVLALLFPFTLGPQFVAPAQGILEAQASFGDVRASLESVSGEDLERFFVDWVERAGAATLKVALDSVAETAGVSRPG